MADAIELGRRIRGAGTYPEGIDLLHPSREQFAEATALFEEYADQDLSFTDVLTVVLVEQHDVDSVLSFDDDFDGIVDRLAPGSIGQTK
jgi:predicted nucleic acid-binding protein